VDSLGFRRFRTELDVPFYIDGRRATPKQKKLFDDAVEEYEDAAGMAAKAEESEHALAEHACSAATRIQEEEMKPEELCDQLMAAMPDKAGAQRLCALARGLPKRPSTEAF
jgi:hypothetical protein